MGKPKGSRAVDRLQDLCMEALFPVLDTYASKCNPRLGSPLLDRLAGELVDKLMEKAYEINKTWSPTWYLFLTPKLTRAFLPWDTHIWRLAKKKCCSLKEILLITKNTVFKTLMLDILPASVVSLDMDGELFYRGQRIPICRNRNWLVEAELNVRRLRIERNVEVVPASHTLCELHLGEAKVNQSDLEIVLQHLPKLTILRHYQMTAALCNLHGHQWRTSPSSLRPYDLTNIDCDFSHVVRCRMEPTAVIPGDALRLAVALCPKATSVRIRFDPNTPHHVVGHIVHLSQLIELSVVCVTSGERPQLEFSDFVPILEKHGSIRLASLEMKVLEDVDPHLILTLCKQLEFLSLSGCGFITPVTCTKYNCTKKAMPLTRLKSLFYADGDDFSWDHSLPQCFWMNTLGSSVKRPNLVECVFLESPRISSDNLTKLLSSAACFSALKILSVSRSAEITVEHLKAAQSALRHVEFIRLNSCDNVAVRCGAVLKRMFPKADVNIDMG